MPAMRRSVTHQATAAIATRVPKVASRQPTSRPAGEAPRSPDEAGLANVVERRAVPAHAAVAEGERAVLHDELVGDELLALALVPRDDAGDRLRALIAVVDPDADAIADAQQLAAPGVVDLELDRPHGDELAVLPRPGEVAQGVPAQTAGVEVLERRPLLV